MTASYMYDARGERIWASLFSIFSNRRRLAHCTELLCSVDTQVHEVL